jgi:hypothetical protein
MPSLNPDHPRRGLNERRHPRKQFFSHISFHSSNRIYNGNIRNISLGGVYIQSLDTFPTGQKLRLVIPFSRKAKTVRPSGRVIWSDQHGFGFEFKRPKA